MGKLKIILITVVAMVGIAALAIYFLDIDLLGKDSPKEISAEELVEYSLDTEVITTNLASANHFAVVQFNILLDSIEAKEELALRIPEVRAAIISSVASFTKDELVGEEGIQKLVTELEKRLTDTVDSGEIDRILVTEFKLQ